MKNGFCQHAFAYISNAMIHWDGQTKSWHVAPAGVPAPLFEGCNRSSVVIDHAPFPRSVIHSGGSLFFVAPPVRCLDIVRVIVSPGSAHAFWILVVRGDVVVVREFFVADRAYSGLLSNFAI
jgi:hypothetical protein